MKDFRRYVRAANGDVVMLTGQMKEWEDLSEYARKDIVEIFAKLAVEAYLHPPPACRFCLRDDCPSLKEKGECPAERPLLWLPSDKPRKRTAARGTRAKRSAPTLDLGKFLDRL
jgi:hypothetical protein